jgi:hypothetical protein
MFISRLHCHRNYRQLIKLIVNLYTVQKQDKTSTVEKSVQLKLGREIILIRQVLHHTPSLQHSPLTWERDDMVQHLMVAVKLQVLIPAVTTRTAVAR